MEKEDRSRGAKKHTLRQCYRCNLPSHLGTFYVLNSDGSFSNRVEYSMDRRRNWEILEDPERLAKVEVILDVPGRNTHQLYYEGKRDANNGSRSESESEESEKLTRVEKKERKQENQSRALAAKDVLRGVNAEIEPENLKDNSKEKRKKERQGLAKTSHKARAGHKRLDVAHNYHVQRNELRLAERLGQPAAESRSEGDEYDDGVDRSNTRAARRQAEKELQAFENEKVENAKAKEKKSEARKKKVSKENSSASDSDNIGDFDSDDGEYSADEGAKERRDNTTGNLNRADAKNREKESILLTSPSLTAKQRAHYICFQCRDGYYSPYWYGDPLADQRNTKASRRQRREACEGDYDVHLGQGKRRSDAY